MKRVSFAMFCGFLVILATGVAIFPQANGQTEIATEKLVVTLRLLTTSEYSYREEHGRFAIIIGRNCSPFCDRTAIRGTQ